MEKRILRLKEKIKELKKNCEEAKQEAEMVQNKEVKDGFIGILDGRIEILNMAETVISDIHHKSEHLSESEKETILSSLEWLI